MIEKIIEKYHDYRRVGKFAITGGISAIASLGTFIVLTQWFAVWYLAASVLGYITSFLVNFFLQKFWTFRNTDTSRVHTQMGLFFVNSILNLVLNTIFMYSLVEFAHSNEIVAQVLVIGILAFMNYTVYRLYIFTPPHENHIL